MQAQWLSKLFALALVIAPAAAQEPAQLHGQGQRPQNETVTLTRGTCVEDDTNSTTYNSAGFQATGTGRGATETYYPVVGVAMEDNAATFGVASMTINGVPAIEIVDEDGTGNSINTALYRGAVETSGSTINVSVTASEALSGSMTICAWGIANLRSFTPVSSVADDDATTGALVLTLSSTTAGGYGVGICAGGAITETATWANLTERDDSETAEHDYSNADGTTAGGSLAVTCTMGGVSGVSSGVAAAFR